MPQRHDPVQPTPGASLGLRPGQDPGRSHLPERAIGLDVYRRGYRSLLHHVHRAEHDGLTARRRSACGELGGTVGPDQFCEIDADTTTYDLTFRFPTDYPDQSALADYLTQRRTQFIDWVSAYSAPPGDAHFELDVIGAAYRSGERQAGTRSLVLAIGSGTGVHPVTTDQDFNCSLTDHAPISFETLFKPGSNRCGC